MAAVGLVGAHLPVELEVQPNQPPTGDGHGFRNERTPARTGSPCERAHLPASCRSGPSGDCAGSTSASAPAAGHCPAFDEAGERDVPSDSEGVSAPISRLMSVISRSTQRRHAASSAALGRPSQRRMDARMAISGPRGYWNGAEDVRASDACVRRNPPVLPVLNALGALGHLEAQSSGHFGGATELINELGILVHGGVGLVHVEIKRHV